MQTSFADQLDHLRTAAVETIASRGYALASGDLSLWGQPTRLAIILAGGAAATVRALGTEDLDVLVEDDGWQPSDPTPRMLRYQDLPTEALVACADYARQMTDVYHDTPGDPRFREDAEFTKTDKLERNA